MKTQILDTQKKALEAHYLPSLIRRLKDCGYDLDKKAIQVIQEEMECMLVTGAAQERERIKRKLIIGESVTMKTLVEITFHELLGFEH